MSIKTTRKISETDEQYSERIRKETREKILKKSQIVDLDALRRSIEIEEPTHLGNLSNFRIPND